MENDPGDLGESNEDLWIVIGEQKVSIWNILYWFKLSSVLLVEGSAGA